MQKFSKTSSALLLGSVSVGAAFAATPDVNTPQATAYLRFGFDNGMHTLSSLNYGMSLQHDPLYVRRSVPDIARLNFDRKGFLNAWLNGLPVAHAVDLSQAEGGGRFTAIDWTLVGAGVAGIGYALSELIDQSDSPDPRTPAPGNMPASTLQGFATDAMMQVPEYESWLDQDMGGMGDLILISK